MTFVLSMHTITIGVIIVIGSFSQAKQVINTSKQHIISLIKSESTGYSLNSQNKINYGYNRYNSSHTKGSISIVLFDISGLPNERRQTTMFCEIPNDFFLPDRKNSRMTQIVNTWTFGRLTPGGNEGVGVKISYLEHAYGMKYYVMDQVNGNINAIHDDSLESTESVGHFCPFDLEELELKVCKITDHHEGQDDSRLDEDKRQVTQSTQSL